MTAAQELGFMPDEDERSRAALRAMALDASLQRTAMDLARFCKVPLWDATWVLIDATFGKYKPLRRLGFAFDERVPPEDVLAFVRIEVDGQAEAYAHTFYGSLDVREAKGHTFSKAFTRFVESLFGPR